MELSVPFRVRIPTSFYTKQHTMNDVLICNGGAGGIRTHGGLHPNGFRDRPVMTASILLRILFCNSCIITKSGHIDKMICCLLCALIDHFLLVFVYIYTDVYTVIGNNACNMTYYTYTILRCFCSSIIRRMARTPTRTARPVSVLIS